MFSDAATCAMQFARDSCECCSGERTFASAHVGIMFSKLRHFWFGRARAPPSSPPPLPQTARVSATRCSGVKGPSLTDFERRVFIVVFEPRQLRSAMLPREKQRVLDFRLFQPSADLVCNQASGFAELSPNFADSFDWHALAFLRCHAYISATFGQHTTEGSFLEQLTHKVTLRTSLSQSGVCVWRIKVQTFILIVSDRIVV